MTDAQKTVWIRDNRCRADDAVRKLESARKQRTAEYNERLRKLNDFGERLFIMGADKQQMEMFNQAELLSPELDELLEAPLHGLD